MSRITLLELIFMDASKVDMFMISNSKFFESHHIAPLRDRLIAVDESKWVMISTLQFKDPTLIIILSVIVGSFGVDRFVIGDTGMGIGKLLTCGGLGIWTIVDWFLIMGATREKNMEMLQKFLY